MENQNNVIKLFKDGEVKTKDGREFTRILGGFGDNKPIITDKQVAELLGYANGARAVRERLNRKDGFGKENIRHFEFGSDIIDLQRVAEKDTLHESLVSLGYAKQSIKQAENIYIFSEAGFLLFLKFAEGDKAVELYKDFLEDYFKTKAENMVMEKTLQDELEFLKNQKALTLGKMFMEQDAQKKIDLFNESETISNRIKDIEVTLSKEQLIEQLQPQLSIAEKFTHANTFYNMGTFAKVLRIKDLGRNNLFEWLRNKEILMSNNQPYQRYMDYFEVLPLENKYTNKINYKTMVRPNGVEYIIKRLIKDGKILTKSVNDILKELETLEVGA